MILQGPRTLCFSVWHYEQCNCRVTQQCCLPWPSGLNVVRQMRPLSIAFFMAIIRNTFITQMYLLLSQTFRNNAGSQGLRLGVKAKADLSLTIVPHIRGVKEFRVLSVERDRSARWPVSSLLSPVAPLSTSISPLFGPLWLNYGELKLQICYKLSLLRSWKVERGHRKGWSSLDECSWVCPSSLAWGPDASDTLRSGEEAILLELPLH